MVCLSWAFAKLAIDGSFRAPELGLSEAIQDEIDSKEYRLSSDQLCTFVTSYVAAAVGSTRSHWLLNRIDCGGNACL